LVVRLDDEKKKVVVVGYDVGGASMFIKPERRKADGVLSRPT
jgi:hypothetical protein